MAYRADRDLTFLSQCSDCDLDDLGQSVDL